MGDDINIDSEIQTQTQTQNSQVEWSQNTPSFIPNIWGRLYPTRPSLNGQNCWKNKPPGYYDLIQAEFSLGRSFSCTYVIRKEMVNENIIKNISKQHFILKRDLSEPLCPAIITDLSHNGTFVNGILVGKGNSRILDDNDVISVSHQSMKIFVFKDLFKNEQDQVPREISKKYYISRLLGQGACGIVKLVYDKIKCTKYAMKIIKKSRLTNGQFNNLNDPKKIMNEINIMKALKHPCVISTEEVMDTRDTVYIILELMQGGELFDRISKQHRLTEQLTRFLFRQMVLAVKYLHSQGITHRDLKPENVLLESKDERTLVKITDFGMSKFVGEDSFMKTMCGTPLYLAPEVLMANGQRCYGPQVDVWSLGVILFVCVTGYLPFSTEHRFTTLKDQIVKGQYCTSLSQWRKISVQGKHLIGRMLTVQPERRITLDEILNHPWMQDEDVIISVNKLLSNTTQMKLFSELTISSTSTSVLDQENSNSDGVTVKLAATGKRALSDSSNSSEPNPKKLKLAIEERNNNDSSSTNSYCSGE
ncbi:ovarian-specific serine/threonine-protein kinase Lok-like [Achroia grisella]|uniref:ovarian-specific serine/threonine-protein kinase Lok-like n=1 Tax=Achroia grisella TaxID=688607 RepID=UPI0027D26CA2|nr:ovarian-specific serine/threonine-protein kinase Lok-like [Achroia grisella]